MLQSRGWCLDQGEHFLMLTNKVLNVLYGAKVPLTYAPLVDFLRGVAANLHRSLKVGYPDEEFEIVVDQPLTVCSC